MNSNKKGYRIRQPFLFVGNFPYTAAKTLELKMSALHRPASDLAIG